MRPTLKEVEDLLSSNFTLQRPRLVGLSYQPPKIIDLVTEQVLLLFGVPLGYVNPIPLTINFLGYLTDDKKGMTVLNLTTGLKHQVAEGKGTSHNSYRTGVVLEYPLVALYNSYGVIHIWDVSKNQQITSFSPPKPDPDIYTPSLFYNYGYLLLSIPNGVVGMKREEFLKNKPKVSFTTKVLHDSLVPAKGGYVLVCNTSFDSSERGVSFWKYGARAPYKRMTQELQPLKLDYFPNLGVVSIDSNLVLHVTPETNSEGISLEYQVKTSGDLSYSPELKELFITDSEGTLGLNLETKNQRKFQVVDGGFLIPGSSPETRRVLRCVLIRTLPFLPKDLVLEVFTLL